MQIWALYRKSLPVRECGLKQELMGLSAAQMVSLPVRECGLKLQEAQKQWRWLAVTPRAGVWIETEQILYGHCFCHCHSPCGSVD